MINLILPLIIGLIIGSFLNVVIYRLPLEISIVSPRSHCINCKNKIPFYYNIPLISYVLLLGKCKSCKCSISLQYPFVEILTGIISVVSWSLEPKVYFIFYIIYFSFLICIMMIDLYYLFIPSSLLYGALGTILSLSYVQNNYLNSILGMIFGFVYFGLIYFFTKIIFKKETMGVGDIFLAIVLGAWLGPFLLFITIFLSAIFSLFILFLHILKNKQFNNPRLPFAPSLIFSSYICYIINPEKYFMSIYFFN